MALGTAYRIIGDVISVTGLQNNAKERGQDLRTGRFTSPAVHFLRAAAPAQRKIWLAELQAATRMLPLTTGCSIRFAGGGILERCRSQARHAVRSESKALERSFPHANLLTLDQLATLVIEDYD